MSTTIVHRSVAVLLLGVLLSVGAACSSESSDPGDGSSREADGADIVAADESGSGSAPATETTDVDVAAADCPALLEGRSGFVTSVSLLTVLDDADALDAALGDTGLVAIEDYVALLRPHQDVEVEVFGSLRVGLQNLEADIAAVREGRIEDRVGDYGAESVSALLDAIGC